MEIRHLYISRVSTNCYLLTSGGEGCIIDPGAEAEQLISAVEKSGCALRYILLTHGHYDHVGAVAELQEKFPEAETYIAEADFREKGGWLFPLRSKVSDVRFYGEGDALPLGEDSIRILATPGHSAGCVTLMAGDTLFTGDTLFSGTCGRTDLLSSDPDAMKDSLHRLAALEGDYRVLPGHGPATTLSRERQYNSYMR